MLFAVRNKLLIRRDLSDRPRADTRHVQTKQTFRIICFWWTHHFTVSELSPTEGARLILHDEREKCSSQSLQHVGAPAWLYPCKNLRKRFRSISHICWTLRQGPEHSLSSDDTLPKTYHFSLSLSPFVHAIAIWTVRIVAASSHLLCLIQAYTYCSCFHYL